MKTKTHVYFGVFGFGDNPEVVTEILRMPPTEAWVKGEPYGALSAGARRTHSRWSLSGGLDEAAPVEAHLHALLGQKSRLKAR